MKKFVKSGTLLPILIGVAVGALLFILGAADDAPGLSLIGLVVAFLLIMWGIYNANVIKKGFLCRTNGIIRRGGWRRSAKRAWTPSVRR